MGARPIAIVAADLIRRYRDTRKLSEELAAPLSDADATVQSMPDASPAKWHLAHTTWFWESFILRDFVDGYRQFDDDYAFLFNSYYEAEGARHARAHRGLLTRPSLEGILTYRAHVDAAIDAAFSALPKAALGLVELGIQHEQQHQELLLTDIKHLLAQNPMKPAVYACRTPASHANSAPIEWHEGPTGIVEIGHDGDGFAFDCEGPRHQVMQLPFAVANRTVTNGEWAEFISDGGYADARHWLSDGWAWVREQAITAPLYWQQDDGKEWRHYTLAGMQPIDPSAPVTHISLYEADAFANWAAEQSSGVRLPTETELELMAARCDPQAGNLLSSAKAPAPIWLPRRADAGELEGVFGNVWEWTGSAYRPYPGFRPADGVVGEYNGKFMSGQFVLRGGSCATPRGHMRASYRNFFYPHQRWQFTGLRLAKDI